MTKQEKREEKPPIYVLHHTLKWRTFKMLQEKFVKEDGGPTPVHMDKTLWQMLRDKLVYLWFDPLKEGNMWLGQKLPKGREVKVLSSPTK